MANRMYLQEPLSAIPRSVLTNDRTKRHGFLSEQAAKDTVAKLTDFNPDCRWEIERCEPTGDVQFTVSGYPH